MGTSVRRTLLAVPGSNERMIDKARGLAVDGVFLDLEDAVSPLVKVQARDAVVHALQQGGFGGKVVTVRVNALSTSWAHDDIEAVVTGAGRQVDTVMLPKVQSADEVRNVAARLDDLERHAGLEPGAIGLDLQIEDALGLVNVDTIAAASPRITSLSFGPADFMASINMKSLVVGLQPPGYTEGDAYHYVLMRILVAGRAFGRQVLDGPYLGIKDLDGLRVAAQRSAALGFDGKWVLHPDQIEVVNAIFSPSQSDYDHAELILDAYDYHTSAAGGARGAAMLGEEMIDEASRAMALVVAAKGRAAGLVRTSRFDPTA